MEAKKQTTLSFLNEMLKLGISTENYICSKLEDSMNKNTERAIIREYWENLKDVENFVDIFEQAIKYVEAVDDSEVSALYALNNIGLN